MSEDMKSELLTKDSLNSSESSDLSYMRETTFGHSITENEKNESFFLGNRVNVLEPRKVGEIWILCYCGDKPMLTIGPHCKRWRYII